MEETKNKKYKRSPAYPAISLEEAINKANLLYEKDEMNFAPVSIIYGYWGYGKNASTGRLVLSALKKFGLLEDKGAKDKRIAKLTELARLIILDKRPGSKERENAIKEAALTPKIHREFWDKYKGSLPSDINLSHTLTFDRHFTNHAAKNLIKELRDTWDFAKLADYDNMSEKENDKYFSESEDEMTISQTTLPSTSERKIISGTKRYSLPVSNGNLADVVFQSSEINEEDVEYLIEGLTLLKKTLGKKDTKN